MYMYPDRNLPPPEDNNYIIHPYAQVTAQHIYMNTCVLIVYYVFFYMHFVHNNNNILLFFRYMLMFEFLLHP